eukprot:CAMPEP_0183298498 /NCGR_PEP_ID=MMETSP0160_2-20130417/5496_1 /TAXON_ID=2839 ORGANISM="Odontella Sinensis, Strain Grunow 1884" /NCGR_SAMPLE_ID=MMETSP0160_2 /ASSEMBLY_ACC=CAM_ASM_000250 /LENGTH=165 /DNA_ID=CAMNT_0025460547 /DNA_START=46 /DNA_END=543 /DNA_ORIENTATION=-
MATTAGIAMRAAARRAAPVFRAPSLSSSAPLSSLSPRFMSTYYTPAHEYIKVDGKIGTMGITDFAQAALGDIVYVELAEVGDDYEKGEAIGSVESVKAASDVYAPVSGTCTEVNEALNDEPGMVNAEAEGEAWFAKIELSDEGLEELEGLMGEEAYKEHCEKEAH